METKLSVEECLKFGWNAFKTRPGILIGGPLLLMVGVSAILFLLMSVAAGIIGVSALGAAGPAGFTGPALLTLILTGGVVMLVFVIIAIVLVTFAGMGLMSFFLKAHDNLASVGLGDLKRMHPFWAYLGALILTTIITQIGLALFIIPGILASLFLVFVPYLILDRGFRVFAAISESVRMVSRGFVSVLLLAIAIIAANFVGALLLGVGLLVTIPVSALAVVHAYRTLSSHTPVEVRAAEPMPAQIPPAVI